MRAVAIAALFAVVAVASVGCAGTPDGPGTLRFHNRDIAWRVNDRVDTPTKPEERQYARSLYHVDGFVVRRLTRKMEAKKTLRAQNVNALDEVPDSTWFTNRIGVREVALDAIRGTASESPELHKPWTITGSKVGGLALGYVIEDARGVRYLLKFDHKRGPEMETAADVIVQRLLWACGYNVPEDNVVFFRREDLRLAPDAENRDVFGNKSAMSEGDLDLGLARVGVGPDGTYRGLVSKYLPGVPIGPYAREGVRKDDPNDLVPHQLRRELRGAYAVFEWLGHTDLQEDNTLDMWHEDPATGRHYVMHYLVDFGKAMGVMSYLNKWKWPGYTHSFDIGFTLRSLLSLGLWKRPYEDLAAPPLVGVGLFEHDNFHPGSWRANSPYWPLEDRDRFDAFWGAKIIIRFSRAHIRAAVEQGRLSDPRSVAYLTETLVARQRKTARYWFRKVNPLDRLEARLGVGSEAGKTALCFEDLAARYALEDVGGTRYIADAFDYSGRSTGFSARAAAGPEGRVCIEGIEPSSSRDGYLIVRIVTDRGSYRLPPTLVHLARDPGARDPGALRVIGLRRE